MEYELSRFSSTKTLASQLIRNFWNSTTVMNHLPIAFLARLHWMMAFFLVDQYLASELSRTHISVLIIALPSWGRKSILIKSSSHAFVSVINLKTIEPKAIRDIALLEFNLGIHTSWNSWMDDPLAILHLRPGSRSILLQHNDRQIYDIFEPIFASMTPPIRKFSFKNPSHQGIRLMNHVPNLLG